MTEPILAHGVGTVYESPIPLGYYLVGAAATVVVSFLIRALARTTKPLPPERAVTSAGATRVFVTILRGVALAGLLLTLVSGLVVREIGFSFTSLAFWVGLIVGTTAFSAIVAGFWEVSDPWATTERFYRLEDAETAVRTPPWWVGPALVYLLFWFELVSGVGFDAFWIVLVLIGYSLFVFLGRASLGSNWALIDPLSIVFGFAARCAPLRLTERGLYRKAMLADLDTPEPMPLALFGSVFILLASTTLDNVKETVGWTTFQTTTGLDALPDQLLESLALAAFTLPFLITFMLAVNISRPWLGRRRMWDLGRHLGWSLVPIGVAYVLAHNTPLIMTGFPKLLALLSDPFERGWNIFGTAGLFSGFVPSAGLVWFFEIAIIVGGHVIGVLSAHRAAVRFAPDHGSAVKSQYALTVLMSVYTITTLWLLSQPLIA